MAAKTFADNLKNARKLGIDVAQFEALAAQHGEDVANPALLKKLKGAKPVNHIEKFEETGARQRLQEVLDAFVAAQREYNEAHGTNLAYKVEDGKVVVTSGRRKPAENGANEAEAGNGGVAVKYDMAGFATKLRELGHDGTITLAPYEGHTVTATLEPDGSVTEGDISHPTVKDWVADQRKKTNDAGQKWAPSNNWQMSVKVNLNGQELKLRTAYPQTMAEELAPA